MPRRRRAYQTYDLLSVQRRFPTELACRKYLARHRWPQGFWCARCGGTQASTLRTRGAYQCCGCRRQVSLTAGTIFHKTRTPLRRWFWLILMMSQNKHGLSILAAQRLVGLRTYETAWTMTHKIRTAMAHRDARYRLAGLIELDDAVFGRKAEGETTRRGSRQRTVRVAVGTNRRGRPTFARMAVAEYAGALHAKAMARQGFIPGQRIRTDGGNAFPVVTELGHRHEPHPKMTPAEMDHWLPWVSTVIANAKRFLLGTHHQESPKHLQRFLDEFTYRFNRRWVQGQLFDRLLTACVTTGFVKSADLSR